MEYQPPSLLQLRTRQGGGTVRPLAFSTLEPYIDATITPRERRACLYLEGRGLKFCVDYGYQNAVALAREDWRKRSARGRGK